MGLASSDAGWVVPECYDQALLALRGSFRCNLAGIYEEAGRTAEALSVYAQVLASLELPKIPGKLCVTLRGDTAVTAASCACSAKR